MKTMLKSLLLFCLGVMAIVGCKKNEFSDIGEGTVVAKEYTFNRATKTFDLGDEVKGSISAADGVKFVYCYLVRTNATDSLILVTDNRSDVPSNYDLSIPLSAFPVNNMSKVKGVKVMVKQGNNSSLEGFITIKYFDPDLPQFSNFPTSLNADLGGGTTAIAGNIQSEYGIKQIDIYDDYQTENVYVLAHSITDVNNAKQYALNYAYTYRKAAQHIKVVATDIYNQTGELIIDMPVDMSIFKPNFLNFPASITPGGGAVPVNGQITSVTGLKKVGIYDDRNGTYQLLGTVDNLNGIKDYNYSANYTFAMRAEHIKIVAVDTEDLQAELVINLDYTYGSVLYRDVIMSAQGTSSGGSTNSIFIAETGAVIGNCAITQNNETMAFLMYGTGTGAAASMVFYSPTNTGSVYANYRCAGAQPVRDNTANFKATRFRVLVKGASSVIDKIYNDVDAGNLDVLDAAYFTGIAAPSGQTAPSYHTSSQVFNLTDASIVYAQIPIGGVLKNCIIKVKELDVNTTTVSLSTIKFDIYIQK